MELDLLKKRRGLCLVSNSEACEDMVRQRMQNVLAQSRYLHHLHPARVARTIDDPLRTVSVGCGDRVFRKQSAESV